MLRIPSRSACAATFSSCSARLASTPGAGLQRTSDASAWGSRSMSASAWVLAAATQTRCTGVGRSRARSKAWRSSTKSASPNGLRTFSERPKTRTQAGDNVLPALERTAQLVQQDDGRPGDAFELIVKAQAVGFDPGQATSVSAVRARMLVFMRMIVIGVQIVLETTRGVVARDPADPCRRRLLRLLLQRPLEQHVHEQVHRLGLEDQGPRRLRRAAVEMLVDAVVVHDRDVAGFPLVAHAVVHLGAFAVEDVEHRFVDVTVFLRGRTRSVFLQVDVQRLPEHMARFEIVLAEDLGSLAILDLDSLANARERAQPPELVFQIVLALKSANEEAILLVAEVLGRHQRDSGTCRYRRSRSAVSFSLGLYSGAVSICSRSFRPHCL